MLTRSLIPGGRELKVNYACSAGGGLQVAVLDMEGKILAEKRLTGDETDQPGQQISATFQNNPAQSIRPRFNLVDADLYAFRF